MAKPLVSETPQPRDIQFKHFGVMNSGAQSKSSLFTSITVNVVLALILIIIGAAARQKVIDNRVHEAILVPIVKEKPPEPIKPKVIPPKPPPPKPPIVPPVPKIVLPKVTPIEPPKVVHVEQPKPLPVVTPAPPKLVVAAAAPKPTTVNLGKSASVVNNDPHPAPVALGQTHSPIAPSNLPATATINLGKQGMAGMPPGSGRGPASTSVNLGSGQPTGSLGGGGARAIAGVKLGGVTGGTGTTPGNGIGSRPQQVALGHPPEPPAAQQTSVAKAPVRSAPQVTYKPTPVYSAEATAMHLEGRVQVRVHVSSTGAVSGVAVTSGLGHGLDEAAVRAAQGTRFKPALDANGNPIDWDGVIVITFQMAG